MPDIPEGRIPSNFFPPKDEEEIAVVPAKTKTLTLEIHERLYGYLRQFFDYGTNGPTIEDTAIRMIERGIAVAKQERKRREG